MSVRQTRIHRINANFKTGETRDQTVIKLETSPPVMAPVWVNFLRQRLHVLDLDYKHIEAGQIVLMSTPRAADSVARLATSAIETADHYVKTLRQNMRAHGLKTR
jgi:hypothetical protein